MLQYPHYKEIRIFGIALAGRDGSPVVVFESPDNGDFLSLPVSPFDAEALIREFTGEGDSDGAAAWIGDLMKKSPPLRGILELDEEETVRIRFSFSNMRGMPDRRLRLCTGFALSNRLQTPLFADNHLFLDFLPELVWLSDQDTFTGNFLYLTTAGYTSNITPV